MAKLLTLILDNLRSAENVGSIFRTGDAAGVAEIICAGITPYPAETQDIRLPHIRTKATKMITKTALGAERSVPFRHVADAATGLAELKQNGYQIYSLELEPHSKNIFEFEPQFPCALLLGSETAGLGHELLKTSDAVLAIPMKGQKESLNVAVAAGIAIYALLR